MTPRITSTAHTECINANDDRCINIIQVDSSNHHDTLSPSSKSAFSTSSLGCRKPHLASLKQNGEMEMQTDSYQTLVENGFYSVEKTELRGKKDHVRKYWEDIATKMFIRPLLERLLQQKNVVRIVDLGAGSGEGFELLTHIPPSNPITSTYQSFVLNPEQIDFYLGIDLSGAMVAQGNRNYAHFDNVCFIQADLKEELPLAHYPPFDLYFSSYASFSHLRPQELGRLVNQVETHTQGRSFLVLDVLGKYSPEWPEYWEHSCQELLPYTMGYLLSSHEQKTEVAPWMNLSFWSPQELIDTVSLGVSSTTAKIRILAMLDRSLLVGRHMDTPFFSSPRQQLRFQVNRLFDLDYRGDIDSLICELSYLDPYKDRHAPIILRLQDYAHQWNSVIHVLDALMSGQRSKAKAMIKNGDEGIADDLQSILWIYDNATKYPVTDFWSSVMGPHIACLLRNFELRLPNALGCGHGLLYLVEITKS